MDMTTIAGTGAGAARLPPGVVRQVSIDRGDRVNSLDGALLERLDQALDGARSDPACRVLVISSGPGVFCTGMNLAAAGRAGAPGTPGGDGYRHGSAPDGAGGDFYDLLHRLTREPLAVVTVVDGEVAGGGLGLVAASDLVHATGRARFALPEALWGLLPCCVLPFLARRIGFQRAYAMALTTQAVDATSAAGWGLVDQVGPEPAGTVRRLALRLARVDRSTIGDLKRYATGLYPISPDTRQQAVTELSRLMALPAVRERLSAFAAHGRYPWEG